MKTNIDKPNILNNICYTALVYGRINKKLKTNYSNSEIESFIMKILDQTQIDDFQKIGKNYYVTNIEYNIVVTINSNTCRIITVDTLVKSIAK
jgi:hypothetical protein